MLASSPARANTVKMSHGLLRTRCELDSEGRELLRHAMEELHLSARAYDRMPKVARTIADLAEAFDIRMFGSDPILSVVLEKLRVYG